MATKTSTMTTPKASVTSKALGRKATAGAASTSPTATTPKPVPKATRSLAAAFDCLGDVRTLQVLGVLSNGLPTTTAAVCAAFGLDTETVAASINSLKRQGWVEGSRVEGSRGYSYKITESGSSTWGKAQAFNATA